MGNKLTRRLLIAGGMIASTVIPSIASAVDFNITGFVREEIAISTDDGGNPTNEHDNGTRTNNVIVPSFGHMVDPAHGNYNVIGNPAATSAGNQQLITHSGFGGCGANGILCNPAGAANFKLVGGYLSNSKNPNPVPTAGNPLNMLNTRSEIEIQAKFNENIAAYGKLRFYFDGTGATRDDGKPGPNYQMAGGPKGYFGSDANFGGGRGNRLEVQNRDMMLDIPALYADFNYGSAWVRVGQQQIAWGEAYFFRVFDVANGLDVRRHLFFGPGAEEYSDQRIASPGLRASYTFGNSWEIDSFLQMFSPSQIPNTFTPYNVVSDGFVVTNLNHDAAWQKMENTLNFGARLIMPDLFLKDLTVSIMAVDRVAPDGVYIWNQNGPFNNPSQNMQAVNKLNPFCSVSGVLGGPASGSNPGPGGSCGQSFFQNPIGTNSYVDWFNEASWVRLDGVKGAATAIYELNASHGLAAANGIGVVDKQGRVDFVQGVSSLVQADGSFGGNGAAAANIAAACTVAHPCAALNGWQRKAKAFNTVSGFFTAFGPLGGTIHREFKREQDVGVGFNYIINTKPGDLLDQLIVRGEVQYTPNRSFTEVSLSSVYDKRDEILADIILEKYQSIFTGIPATYLVAEWMHRTQSDLAGRLLDGYNGSGTDAINGSEQTRSNFGLHSMDYFVFAFQQPFPNLIWRADFAMLADRMGGIFIQPGLRYKPSGAWQIDLYANEPFHVGGNNNNLMQTFENMKEVFTRVTYYF